MRRAKVFALAVVFLVGGIFVAQQHLRQRVPIALAAGWQYQVGITPSLYSSSTHIYSNLNYNPSNIVIPPSDSGNWASFWNAASDTAYSSNWYQVGYSYFASGNPYGAPQHEVFIQTTAAPGYMWCESGWGLHVTNGANGQPQAGCSGSAESLGLQPGNTYSVEIYTSQDCAYGPNGCIYGCNGNTRFAIAGIEIGHFADCSNYQGMSGFSAAVLEPTDAYGVTPITATPGSYAHQDYFYGFAAIINGSYTPVSSVSKYCGYSPPSGAGTNIYSGTNVRAASYSASCTGTSSPIKPFVYEPNGSPVPPGASPTPVPGSGKVYDPARGNLPLHKPPTGGSTATGPLTKPSPTAVR